MTFKRLLLFLLVAVSGFVRAQTAPPAKDSPYEFKLIALNVDLPGLFYEQSGKKQPTPLIEYSLSPSFTYSAPTGKLTLYAPILVDGVPVKTPLADVTLVPPPSKNIIILWHEKSGRYGSAVLADDPQTPPPGHMRFVNISGQTLAFQCNKTNRFILEPGADKIVAPINGGIGIGVKVARQRKKSDHDSWELALMNAIRIGPRERVTVFITNPDHLAPSVRNKPSVDPNDEEKLRLFFITDTVAK